MEKDNDIVKVALAYEMIIQNNFGISQNDLRKYKSKIHEEMRDVIIGLRAIADNSFMEDDNVLDTKETVESNVKNVFLKHINKFIQQSNYSKNFGLIYNQNKLLDLVNIISEYSNTLLKEYMIYGMERFMLDVEIKDAVTDALIHNVNFKEYGKDIYNETVKSLGLNGIKKLSAFNLGSKAVMTENDINFNLSLHDNVYYNHDLDYTYFTHNNNILVVRGEYKTKEDILASNEALKEAILDYDNMMACIGRNPVGYHCYQAANKKYYYLINNVYYKSEKEYSVDDINNNFDGIRHDFIRLNDLKHINVNNVASFGTHHTSEYMESIKATAKLNIKNILSAYKKGDRTVAENKTYTLNTIKDSFKAYENACREEIDNIKWFKWIRSFFKMRSINSLKHDVISTLRINNREFDNVIYNSNKEIPNALDASISAKDALSKMTEENVCGMKYLTNNIKKNSQLEAYSKEDIKKMVSKNIALDISSFDFKNDTVDLDVSEIAKVDDLDNNSVAKDIIELDIKNDDVSLDLLEDNKELFDANVSNILENIENDNSSMRIEIDELKNVNDDISLSLGNGNEKEKGITK